MGIFSEWQPQYDEHGIATFPVLIEGKDKRPYGRGWQRVGRPGSRKLAERFTDCNAFGINLKASRITVLDVDTPDEKVLADALDEFGPTPCIVRTGSGNWQAWYRNTGERRQVRPDRRRPIDILGDGYVVAAPSLGTKGRYHFVEGGLDVLPVLPTMCQSVPAAAPAAAKPSKGVEPGTRNRDLFDACMAAAGSCGSAEALIQFARQHSIAHFHPPLPDEEVLRTAASAWNYEARGLNRYGQGRMVHLSHDLIDQLAASDTDALGMLVILNRHHWMREEFALSKAMAAQMGWSLPRWRAARDRLEALGEIECLHAGGKGPNDPPRYRLSPKGCGFVPQ